MLGLAPQSRTGRMLHQTSQKTWILAGHLSTLTRTSSSWDIYYSLVSICLDVEFVGSHVPSMCCISKSRRVSQKCQVYTSRMAKETGIAPQLWHVRNSPLPLKFIFPALRHLQIAHVELKLLIKRPEISADQVSVSKTLVCKEPHCSLCYDLLGCNPTATIYRGLCKALSPASIGLTIS